MPTISCSSKWQNAAHADRRTWTKASIIRRIQQCKRRVVSVTTSLTTMRQSLVSSRGQPVPRFNAERSCMCFSHRAGLASDSCSTQGEQQRKQIFRRLALVSFTFDPSRDHLADRFDPVEIRQVGDGPIRCGEIGRQQQRYAAWPILLPCQTPSRCRCRHGGSHLYGASGAEQTVCVEWRFPTQ